MCAVAPLVRPGASHAQDLSKLGGDLTTGLPGRFAIQLPAPNVIEEDRKILMLDGFPTFHRLFTSGQGVGPALVNNSCGGCHVQNGRGPIRFSRTNSEVELTTMVVKVGLGARRPAPLPGIGDQLQNHAPPAKPRFRLSLRWKFTTGRYADGSVFKLRRPILRFRIPGFRARKVLHSLRMTPAVIGTGLIESISEESLLALADPEDLDGNGISGRPHMVMDLRRKLPAVGRFGFRASQPTVEQQTLAALFGDMGITSDLFSDGSGAEPEFPASQIDPLVFYQKLAGVPAARSQDDPRVVSGKAIFQAIGCSDCHIPTLVTSSSADPELAGQTIHPFTDLLLHDMGAGLASNLAEPGAKRSEWRTTPLWGLGFSETISEVKPVYLHDGRARTLEEAILWHGGEGKRSRESFRKLDRSARDDLVAFLRSL